MAKLMKWFVCTYYNLLYFIKGCGHPIQSGQVGFSLQNLAKRV